MKSENDCSKIGFDSNNNILEQLDTKDLENSQKTGEPDSKTNRINHKKIVYPYEKLNQRSTRSKANPNV